MTEPYRYDVKISGGRVPLDVAPGKEIGIVVHDPVYVFTNEDDISPCEVIAQGHEEYFIHTRAWFGSTGKARMIVTVYDA